MENTTAHNFDIENIKTRLLELREALGWGYLGYFRGANISLYNITSEQIEYWDTTKYEKVKWDEMNASDLQSLEFILDKHYPKQFNVYREKYLINFKNENTNEILAVDLKNQKFLKTNAKGKSRVVKYPNTFFRGVDGRVVAMRIPSDDHFKKLVKTIIGKERHCRNMGTFLVRLMDNIHLETYISANVDFSPYIRVGYNFFDKDVRTLLEAKKMKYDESVERFFGNDHDISKSVLYHIKDRKDFKELFSYISYQIRDLMILIKDYGYDVKTLIEYCNKHNWSSRNAVQNSWYYRDILSFLADYARMANLVFPNGFHKYPENLVEHHDGVSRLYQKEQIKFNDTLYRHTIDLAFEYKGKEFSIVYPKSTGDIQSEGRILSHCVGSYVDRVIKGHTRILFMRKNTEIGTPLVTVEVYDKRITQARGKYNRSLSYDEKIFLQEYAQKKKLQYA